ncbi:MAG: hypothetical protein IJ381_00940 [Clostridia bacterium]|nr:hypothetical protein [Clostridia bacterium]
MDKTNSMMEQMQKMKQEFPYSAQEMLSDPQQVQAYKQELEQRMRNAQTEREQLTQDIQKMIGGVKVRG